jgi:hypothetical protein
MFGGEGVELQKGWEGQKGKELDGLDNIVAGTVCACSCWCCRELNLPQELDAFVCLVPRVMQISIYSYFYCTDIQWFSN